MTTPGPWTRRSIPGHLFELQGADGNPVLRIRGGMMPALDDARLLEAAPELLAAAESLLWNMPAPRSRVRMAEWEALRAAIAKARGSV